MITRYFRANAKTIGFTQFLSTVIALLTILYYPIMIQDILEILIGYFLLSCIGITIFYHRFLSHRSFQTSNFIRKLGVLLGALAGRGGPLDWVAVHRYHHKHSDTDNDPHDPAKKGWRIFFPHLLNYGNNINPLVVKDLLSDKFYRFLNQYYNLILLLVIFLGLLIDPKTIVFLYIIPLALTAWVLNLFVYMNHIFGYRNYETPDKSKNNWLISVILWGEGWHNNHHYNPQWWNLRKKIWEVDSASFVIKLIKTNK
jgi:stearoyl-CoA desaturase (delta-9 desaturase)